MFCPQILEPRWETHDGTVVGELAIDTDMLGVEIGEREAGGVAAMGTNVWVTGGRSLVRMLGKRRRWTCH